MHTIKSRVLECHGGVHVEAHLTRGPVQLALLPLSFLVILKVLQLFNQLLWEVSNLHKVCNKNQNRTVNGRQSDITAYDRLAISTLNQVCLYILFIMKI